MAAAGASFPDRYPLTPHLNPLHTGEGISEGIRIPDKDCHKYGSLIVAMQKLTCN